MMHFTVIPCGDDPVIRFAAQELVRWLRETTTDFTMELGGWEPGRPRAQFEFLVGLVRDAAPGVIFDGVEDEALESAFADLIEQGFYTVDDLHDIKMGCDSTFAVVPGQTSEDRAATYGMVYVTSLEQYELMEPDMLTIQFLHDGEIYEEYYDYKTGSYTLSSDVIDAGQWGESELAEAVPRPEDALVVDVSDRDTQFSFEVACMTAEEFEDYVAAVSDAGYTVDVAETDTTYYADNEEGTYHVDLMYWDESGRLDAYVSYVEE